MSKKRRICLYGGPCSGKSTSASWLFSHLKEKNKSVELVTEYVKGWTYIGRNPEPIDQIYILGKQINKEHVVLKNNIDIIVTDAPLLLNVFYAKYLGLKNWDKLIDIVDEFEEKYPALHIFLERDNFPYFSVGRYQTEEEAKEIDSLIFEMLLSEAKKTIHVVKAVDREKLVDVVLENIS